MKALPQSLLPLHLAGGAVKSEQVPATETHPLAEKLRHALATPHATDIATLARIVEALRAELAMASPDILDRSSISDELSEPADASHSVAGLIARMEVDDEQGKPLPA